MRLRRRCCSRCSTSSAPRRLSRSRRAPSRVAGYAVTAPMTGRLRKPEGRQDVVDVDRFLEERQIQVLDIAIGWCRESGKKEDFHRGENAAKIGCELEAGAPGHA